MKDHSLLYVVTVQSLNYFILFLVKLFYFVWISFMQVVIQKLIKPNMAFYTLHFYLQTKFQKAPRNEINLFDLDGSFGLFPDPNLIPSVPDHRGSKIIIREGTVCVHLSDRPVKNVILREMLSYSLQCK
jgi:hypothetical protein